MLFNVEIRGMRPIIHHSGAGLDPEHPANIEKPDGRAAWPARPGWISQQRYCRELFPRRGRLYYCGDAPWLLPANRGLRGGRPRAHGFH